MFVLRLILVRAKDLFRNQIVLYAGFSVALMSCTTTTTQSFRATGNPAVDASYIATDAYFSQYHRLVADDMGIFFPQNSGLSNEELGRIRAIFRSAFLAELTEYRIVAQPGQGTMKVQASLVDLRSASAGEIPGLRRDIRSIAQPGRLLFLMELKDSETDRVLGRAADSAVAPRFASGATDWEAVEAAAQHWADLFRDFLDRNLEK